MIPAATDDRKLEIDEHRHGPIQTATNILRVTEYQQATLKRHFARLVITASNNETGDLMNRFCWFV